jgi:hypothetical protein
MWVERSKRGSGDREKAGLSVPSALPYSSDSHPCCQLDPWPGWKSRCHTCLQSDYSRLHKRASLLGVLGSACHLHSALSSMSFVIDSQWLIQVVKEALGYLPLTFSTLWQNIHNIICLLHHFKHIDIVVWSPPPISRTFFIMQL